jgi:hypothetical protein
VDGHQYRVDLSAPPGAQLAELHPHHSGTSSRDNEEV